MKSDYKVNKFNFEKNDLMNHKLLNHLNMELFLAVLQKDVEKVKKLLAQGADANFQAPAKHLKVKSNYEASKTAETIETRKFLAISKYNHQIVVINATNGDKQEELKFSNEETMSLIHSALVFGNPCLDVIDTLVKAGVDIKQTENFDLLKQAIDSGDDNIAIYFSEQGLDPHFKSDNSRSAFELATIEGNLEVLDHFVTKNSDLAIFENINLYYISINDQNFKCIELLLNAGFRPDQNMVNAIIEYGLKNLSSLQKIVKYDFCKNDYCILDLWDYSINNRDANYIKILLKSNLIKKARIYQSLDDKAVNERDEIDNYIFVYKITDGITFGDNLNPDDIKIFNDLLSNNKDCADIFLYNIKSDILENGYYKFNEDLTSMFPDMNEKNTSDMNKLIDYLNLQYPNVIPKQVLNQITDGDLGIFDILEKKYLEGLKNLKEILVTALNPELMYESIPFEHYKQFYNKNILSKEDLHYLYKFFNDEYAVNNLAYLMQQIPGLASTVRPIVDTVNMHFDDGISNKIKCALDLYYTNPSFEYDNAEVSGNSSNLFFPEES